MSVLQTQRSDGHYRASVSLYIGHFATIRIRHEIIMCKICPECLGPGAVSFHRVGTRASPMANSPIETYCCRELEAPFSIVGGDADDSDRVSARDTGGSRYLGPV